MFAAPFAIRRAVRHSPLWKASGDIEKQQRMANGLANRGSLFNVRRAVLYLFLKCSLFKVRYSRFAIQCSPRRSPFAALFAIRLVIRRAVRHSPRRSPFASSIAEPFAIRRAIRCRFSMFPDAFHRDMRPARFCNFLDCFCLNNCVKAYTVATVIGHLTARSLHSLKPSVTSQPK